jgi:hypothetical protein
MMMMMMTPAHCDKSPLKEITLRTKEKKLFLNSETDQRALQDYEGQHRIRICKHRDTQKKYHGIPF